jgi:hypothetical protein
MPFGSKLTSAHNLFGRFLNGTSEDHLIFTAKDKLTKELSQSTALMELRGKYLQSGDTSGPSERRFNNKEQAMCPLDYEGYFRGWDSVSMPLTCIMGSFYYQFKTIKRGDGSYIGFRI